MTKLHFLHDWQVTAEKSILLPCKRIYGSDASYKIDSDSIFTQYAEYKLKFNIQIKRCWICNKLKYKVLDAKGYDHTKEIELWVAKELIGYGD